MAENKCICDILDAQHCRVHNDRMSRAFDWADDYYRTNEELLSLELFHREMLEVAHRAGQDTLQAENKVLRAKLEKALDCLSTETLLNRKSHQQWIEKYNEYKERIEAVV